MFRQFFIFLYFELKLAFLSTEGMWGGIAYFLLSLMIMPFTLDIVDFDLVKIAPTMIWVSIIPAILISSNQLFIQDIEDGFIDRYPLMHIGYEMIFVAKICVMLIGVILPLLCIIPVASILFSMPSATLIRLYAGLIATMPAIAFFTGFGTLLSLHGRMGHLLTFIVVIPLIIPAIILGAGTVYSAQPLFEILKLPILFSLISILVTVPAGAFLYQQLSAYR